MILLAVVVLAFGLAIICGGSIGQFARLRLRFKWLALTAILIQSVAVATAGMQDATALWAGAAALLGSHAAMLFFTWQNRRYWPMWLAGAGVLLNLTVMTANGGYMPVAPETVVQVRPERASVPLVTGERVTRTKDFVLPRDETWLPFLSDTIIIEHPALGLVTGDDPHDQPSRGSFVSIGDLLVATGVVLVIWTATRPLPREATGRLSPLAARSITWPLVPARFRRLG